MIGEENFDAGDLDFLKSTESLAISRQNCSKFLVRGHLFNDKNCFTEAIGSYVKAIECDPGCVAAYQSLVNSFEVSENYDAAMNVIISAFNVGLGILDGIDFSKYDQSLLNRLEDAMLA